MQKQKEITKGIFIYYIDGQQLRDRHSNSRK